MCAPVELALPPGIVPHDYQNGAVDALRNALGLGHRSVLLQCPTGGGKTWIMALIFRLMLSRGKRGVFFAHQRELIIQMSRTLDLFQVPHGIIMDGFGYKEAPIQVCSKDTVLARAIRHKHIDLPQGDVVMVDEARLSGGHTYRALLAQYPKSIILGFDATPARTDGRGLGDTFTELISTVSIPELISLGQLVPLRVFAPYKPDLAKCRTKKKQLVKGDPDSAYVDYVEADLDKTMNQPKLVGDIVKHWLDLADNRQTFAFATSIKHSLAIRDSFLAAGVPAEHIDGRTKPEDREGILGRLRSGQTRVVSNVGVACCGVDVPPVSCCILARPTKSLVLMLQIVGRVLRACRETGKKDALLLDHSGAVYEHGMPDEPIEWSLEATQRIEEKLKQERQKNPAKNPITCPQCYATFAKSNCCPNCGFIVQMQGVAKEMKEGRLVAITREDAAAHTHDDYAKAWTRLLAWTAHSNRKPRLAAYRFKEEYGVLPWQVKPALPNIPTGSQWDQLTKDLYPGFVDPSLRGKKKHADQPSLYEVHTGAGE